MVIVFELNNKCNLSVQIKNSISIFFHVTVPFLVNLDCLLSLMVVIFITLSTNGMVKQPLTVMHFCSEASCALCVFASRLVRFVVVNSQSFKVSVSSPALQQVVLLPPSFLIHDVSENKSQW